MTISYTSEAPTPEDFKALYDTTGWGPAERDLSFYEDALRGSWATCSALADGRLVGFGRIISDGKLHAFITEMIVAPAFQSRGIGRTILDRLVACCLSRGVTDIQLFSAEGKEGFYASGGFVARAASRPGMQYASVHR